MAEIEAINPVLALLRKEINRCEQDLASARETITRLTRQIGYEQESEEQLVSYLQELRDALDKVTR